MFSYGENVLINFSGPVTQLVGPNGAGKSSIPVILEELFYNKNSRGVKKSSIKNRYSAAKAYSAESEFLIGKDSYKLTKSVASTATVKLFKNGQDISGHTATQTYEIVEKLLGMDFTTFTKLVYQSMRSNLDFLLATDANRKKFLVSLLGLEAYSEIAAKIKDKASAVKSSLTSVQNTIKTMLPYTTKELPKKMDLVDVPAGVTYQDKIDELVNEIKELELQNQAIEKNNQSIARLNSLVEVLAPTILANPAQDEAKEERHTLQAAQNELKSLSVPATKCPTCGTPYNNADHANHIQQRILELNKLVAELKPVIAASDEKLAKAKKDEADFNAKFLAYQKYLSTKEALESSIDRSLPEVSKADTVRSLKAERLELERKRADNIAAIEAANAANHKAELHNAKVESETQQILKIRDDIAKFRVDEVIYQDRLDKLEILSKVFGTKGLIAYKIESMTKTFEQLINDYLAILSDGRFNLVFQVEDTKLALKLYDHGEEIEIESLSSGEFNRVNTSTLLAIRKVMAAMAKVDINVLFLDEVISVLDKEGKDTLISVLLEEQELNSIVVSHGYTHPLAEKIEVYKEGSISNVK